MRSVKMGANGSMNHASGAGSFSHPTVTTLAGEGYDVGNPG